MTELFFSSYAAENSSPFLLLAITTDNKLQTYFMLPKCDPSASRLSIIKGEKVPTDGYRLSMEVSIDDKV